MGNRHHGYTFIPFPLSESDPEARQACVLVPANKGWTKSARLWMRHGSLRAFKLLEVPKPPPSDPVYGQNGRFLDPGRTRCKATGWYRIAYGVNPVNGKFLMSRFRLSSEHTVYTLHWIADYLNSAGVEWLHLCNGDGARLPYSGTIVTR